MRARQPSDTRTAPLFPDTTLFRPTPGPEAGLTSTASPATRPNSNPISIRYYSESPRRSVAVSAASMLSPFAISAGLPPLAPITFHVRLLRDRLPSRLTLVTHRHSVLPRRARPGRRAVHGSSPASGRSEEHTSELQSLMRTSYAVFCLQKKN